MSRKTEGERGIATWSPCNVAIEVGGGWESATPLHIYTSLRAA
jgi:hypothetical protein